MCSQKKDCAFAGVPADASFRRWVDKEAVSKHVLKLHFENMGHETLEEDLIYNVRDQLGLEPLLVEDVPGSIDVIAPKKTAKKISKKAPKKNVKTKAYKK